MGTLETTIHGRWRIARGNEAPEEFPKVYFTISYEGTASLESPANRVLGHEPVEVSRPLAFEYKEEVS